MTINAAIKEQFNFNELSKEAMQVIEILEQIENHTADLRKKLMAEIRPASNAIHIKLDNV